MQQFRQVEEPNQDPGLLLGHDVKAKHISNTFAVQGSVRLQGSTTRIQGKPVLRGDLEIVHSDIRGQPRIQGVVDLRQTIVADSAVVENYDLGYPIVLKQCEVYQDSSIRTPGSFSSKNYAPVLITNTLLQGHAHIQTSGLVCEVNMWDNAQILNSATVAKATLHGSTVIRGTACILGGDWKDCYVDQGYWEAPGKPLTESEGLARYQAIRTSMGLV